LNRWDDWASLLRNDWFVKAWKPKTGPGIFFGRVVVCLFGRIEKPEAYFWSWYLTGTTASPQGPASEKIAPPPIDRPIPVLMCPSRLSGRHASTGPRLGASKRSRGGSGARQKKIDQG